EYVQNQFRLPREELVVILNSTRKKYDLGGWSLVYENVANGKILHVHRFKRLEEGSSYDPGERLCVISGKGEDEFYPKKEAERFPVPYWDIFTNTSRQYVMDLPSVRLQLLDEENTVLDVAEVNRRRPRMSSSTGRETARPGIKVFIGHGHDPQWR